MTTTNSSWFTSTKKEYHEAPLVTFNSERTVPFSVTIADGAMDAIADVVNLVKLPQSSKIAYIYYAIANHDNGGETDIDIQITETTGGSTTTTLLLNGGTVGQAAGAAFVFPAVGSSYLHEGIPTDDGTATIRLYQNATISTDAAGTIKGYVVYL